MRNLVEGWGGVGQMNVGCYCACCLGTCCFYIDDYGIQYVLIKSVGRGRVNKFDWGQGGTTSFMMLRI